MAKFSLPVMALLASSAFGFAPTTTVPNSASSSSPASTTTSLFAESPLAPLTLWGPKIKDIALTQNQYKSYANKPGFAPTISARSLGIDGDKNAQVSYIKENAFEIKTKMVENGAVIFRDFELMKEQEGFVKFYEALGMKTCLDPLHSVSARPTVNGDKNSPVYEAVNKESRKNFFIGKFSFSCVRKIIYIYICLYKEVSDFSLLHSGMHNEFVGTRAPRAAAFVCFKAAETGGEFLIADGRAIFRDLKQDLIEKLYNRSIRYSVMELPFFGWLDNVPEFAQGPLKGVIKGLAGAAINAKVDFSVDLQWGEGGYDNVRMLQARAPKQPPIVVHPVTGDPTWFCNVHSHSSKLRKDREQM